MKGLPEFEARLTKQPEDRTHVESPGKEHLAKQLREPIRSYS